MSRKVARDILFKLVFELCFAEPQDTNSYGELLQNEELKPENVSFVKDNYAGIIEHQQEITDVIAKNMKGYTIERLFKVDLAILLVATYELMFSKDTHTNIVVNEAVELAKKYSTDKSYSFINAVLANIIKSTQE